MIPAVSSGRVRRDLFSQQEENRRKSSWLLIGFIGFFAWLGFGGDVALMLSTADATNGYQHRVPVIGIGITLVAAGVAWSAWRNGDRQILWSTRARELINAVTRAQQRLASGVDEMSIASGLPRPKLWIVPDDDPNAFATGRDPAHASIAVTEGLLTRLDRDELQAVVAHEMAHVARYDTRLMTLGAAMVGAIALLSDCLGRAGLPLSRLDDNAALVLLEGTVRLAISQVGGTTSRQFRDELITDLACVILESEDLLGLDRLVDRISRRAYRRTKRRMSADSQWAERAVDIEWGLERLEPVRSPEEIVLPRLHLEHVYGLVNRAIESGELANYIWDDFRAGTLAPQLGYPRSDSLKHRLGKRAEPGRTALAQASGPHPATSPGPRLSPRSRKSGDRRRLRGGCV